jgi:hypothetical protein
MGGGQYFFSLGPKPALDGLISEIKKNIPVVHIFFCLFDRVPRYNPCMTENRHYFTGLFPFYLKDVHPFVSIRFTELQLLRLPRVGKFVNNRLERLWKWSRLNLEVLSLHVIAQPQQNSINESVKVRRNTP